MKKYDVSYFEGTTQKVVRLYASRNEIEIRTWFEDHLGAESVVIREADTTDERNGKKVVRI